MKFYKRIMAMFLAMLLLIATMPMSVFAAETNTPKEEVVYININHDGSVKEIYVVNIFELDDAGKIIDYGEYETLRNMTTTDNIGYSDSKVTIDTDAGKLYYEGKLNSNVMPWKIDIHYYMDGKEYSAKDIAGKSGALKITMSIHKNETCNSSFFEGYALQATLALDTDKCKDIVAENATIANVGTDKQLTYTILPNKETDIEITANVDNFEMDGISINGIQLNLNVEIDDAELQEKIDEILEAIKELDEGTDKLTEGAGKLHSATGTLDEKVSELHTGVGTLSGGANNLYNGLSTLAGKNTELTNGAWSAYIALCTAAQMQLNVELVSNGLDEVTLTPENYSAVLMDVLSKMDADKVYEQAYSAALQEVTAQVEAQADEIYKGYIQSQAETLYVQAATQAIYEQLINSGYTAEQAEMYLQTQEGQEMVAQLVATMTEEQKQQVLQSALESLTEEQKTQIRNTYIEQMMASEEVTQKIADAVRKVNEAAAKVTELKGQLDNYDLFYQGLLAYTSGVSEAVNGANSLADGLGILHTNTNTLETSVGELHIAMGELSEGSKELNDGTNKFVEETSGMDKEVSDEIDSLIESISGGDEAVVSFVSEKNTDVKSVQFVIKTDAIQIEEVEAVVVEKEVELSFWQKLLRLFGFEF